MKRFVLIAIVIILLFPLTGISINKTYTVADGLASDIVYSILEDNRGFVWFGTNNGVSQFDGYTFKNYSIDDGLTDNEVFKIFQDSKGRIWFLTYNGKLCYYWEGKIHNEKNTPFLGNIKVSSFFTQAIESANHDIYFLKEYSKQLYKLSGEIFSKVEIDNSYQYNSLLKKNSSICIVTISMSNSGEKKYSLYSIDSKPMLLDSMKSALIYSQFNYFSNNYVVLNRGLTGIGKSSLNWGTTFKFSNSTTIDSINAPSLNSSGYFGNSYFVATSNGLYLYDSNLQLQKKLFDNLPVTSCLIDFENGIWAGTKGQGVYYCSQNSAQQILKTDYGAYKIYPNPFDKNELWISSIGEYFSYNMVTDEIKRYTLPEATNKKDLITDIAFIDKKTLLIGNGNGVTYLNKERQTVTPDKAGIKKILIDNDSIYYARSNGIIKQHISQLFNKCTYRDSAYKQLYNHRTNTLFKTNNYQGKIWFGTAEGLFYFNNKKVIKYSDEINTRIIKITESKNSNLTIGSDLDGIYVLINDDSILHLTTQDGLISNRINTLHYDNKGTLWAGTARGISKIIFEKSVEIENYSTPNGLPDINVNDIYSLNDSTLILATLSGLYKYNYTRKIVTKKPTTNLLWIKVNSKNSSKNDLFNLKYNENNIEISYTGISYASNKNIEYWYTLKSESESEKWSKANIPYLNFIALSPGKYSLLLKCKNVQGTWSDSIEIPIVIYNPFYKTLWFYLITITLVIFTVLVLFLGYRKKILKEQKTKQLISDTRQKALRAQLNPHFIFNALNSIQYLFLSDKENLAQEYLAKFSNILRNTLNFSDKTYITLAAELQNVVLYMELEQIRKKDFFDFHISIDSTIDTEDISVPSMFLQPLIENAIWHGIDSIQVKGKIDIRITDIDADYFEISISDNGIGYSKGKLTNTKLHQHESKGSALIHDRIKTLNFKKGETAQLQIIDLEHGTCVKIKLPKKYNHD